AGCGGTSWPTFGCGRFRIELQQRGRIAMKLIARGTLGLASASASLIFMIDRPAAEQKELRTSADCDRTCATPLVGVILCAGIMDYIDLTNPKGGVEGYRIRLDEIDHEYKVPPAIEAYERYKAQGAVSIMLYGTPQTQALTQKLNEDKIPGTSPGF